MLVDHLLGDARVSALTNEIVRDHHARVCGHQKLSEMLSEKYNYVCFWQQTVLRGFGMFSYEIKIDESEL